MVETRTCNACERAKPLEDFERLHSGSYRGTCKACRLAANAARKRERAEAYRASPEYQAKLERERQDKLEREALRAAEAERKQAEKAQAKLEREAHMAAEADRQRAEREQAALAREERKAALRDDIWSAMRRGRARRALIVTKPSQTGTHRIKLKDRAGYITVAELACRVAERDACHRACRACTTYEAVAEAVRILERPTETRQRICEVNSLWRGDAWGRESALDELTEPEEEADPFKEAFGDWGPSWMTREGYPNTGHHL